MLAKEASSRLKGICKTFTCRNSCSIGWRLNNRPDTGRKFSPHQNWMERKSPSSPPTQIFCSSPVVKRRVCRQLRMTTHSNWMQKRRMSAPYTCLCVCVCMCVHVHVGPHLGSGGWWRVCSSWICFIFYSSLAVARSRSHVPAEACQVSGNQSEWLIPPSAVLCLPLSPRRLSHTRTHTCAQMHTHMPVSSPVTAHFLHSLMFSFIYLFIYIRCTVDGSVCPELSATHTLMDFWWTGGMCGQLWANTFCKHTVQTPWLRITSTKQTVGVISPSVCICLCVSACVRGTEWLGWLLWPHYVTHLT